MDVQSSNFQNRFYKVEPDAQTQVKNLILRLANITEGNTNKSAEELYKQLQPADKETVLKFLELYGQKEPLKVTEKVKDEQITKLENALNELFDTVTTVKEVDDSEPITADSICNVFLTGKISDIEGWEKMYPQEYAELEIHRVKLLEAQAALINNPVEALDVEAAVKSFECLTDTNVNHLLGGRKETSDTNKKGGAICNSEVDTVDTILADCKKTMPVEEHAAFDAERPFIERLQAVCAQPTTEGLTTVLEKFIWFQNKLGKAKDANDVIRMKQFIDCCIFNKKYTFNTRNGSLTESEAAAGAAPGILNVIFNESSGFAGYMPLFRRGRAKRYTAITTNLMLSVAGGFGTFISYSGVFEPPIESYKRLYTYNSNYNDSFFSSKQSLYLLTISLILHIFENDIKNAQQYVIFLKLSGQKIIEYIPPALPDEPDFYSMRAYYDELQRSKTANTPSNLRDKDFSEVAIPPGPLMRLDLIYNVLSYDKPRDSYTTIPSITNYNRLNTSYIISLFNSCFYIPGDIPFPRRKHATNNIDSEPRFNEIMTSYDNNWKLLNYNDAADFDKEEGNKFKPRAARTPYKLMVHSDAHPFVAKSPTTQALLCGVLSQLVYNSTKTIKTLISDNKNLKYLESYDIDPAWVLNRTDEAHRVYVKHRVHAFYKIVAQKINLYIVFRGSHSEEDWKSADMLIATGAAPYFEKRVHDMIHITRLCQAKLAQVINSQIGGRDTTFEVNTYTSGHSLGGFLALMLTYKAISEGILQAQVQNTERALGRQVTLNFNSPPIPIVFNPFCAHSKPVTAAISCIPKGYVYRVYGENIVSSVGNVITTDLASSGLEREYTRTQLDFYNIKHHNYAAKKYYADYTTKIGLTTQAHILYNFIGMYHPYITSLGDENVEAQTTDMVVQDIVEGEPVVEARGGLRGWIFGGEVTKRTYTLTPDAGWEANMLTKFNTLFGIPAPGAAAPGAAAPGAAPTPQNVRAQGRARRAAEAAAEAAARPEAAEAAAPGGNARHGGSSRRWPRKTRRNKNAKKPSRKYRR